jgi:hypothetical protein
MLGGTQDIRAYGLYLSARALLDSVGRGGDDRDSVEQSLEQIGQAIGLDYKFALAWVLKSKAHDAAQIYFPEEVNYHAALAEEAARRARKLAPSLPQAHLELAFKALRRFKWRKAEREFAQASGDDMGQYAYLLVNTGHIRRAHELFSLSQERDSDNANLCMYLIVTNDILGDPKAALGFYSQGLKAFVNPLNWPAGHFNALVVMWGQRDDARAKKLLMQQVPPIPGPVFAAVTPAYDASPKDVPKLLDTLYRDPKCAGPLNRMAIAACAAYFGEHELALNALAEACEAVPLYAHKFWQPLFREVRKLDDFKLFMRSHGFLRYWKRYGWPDQCRPTNAGFTCD